MPHQCIHCSEIYEDGSKEILEGCSKCHGKFFFYLSEEKFRKLVEERKIISDGGESGTIELAGAEKKQIEQDVRDIIGIEDEEAPVILDFESVKVISPGKYLLDIPNLLSKKRPLVYKLEDGKYIIDLASKGKEKLVD